jgi:hypothetical protein
MNSKKDFFACEQGSERREKEVDEPMPPPYFAAFLLLPL